MTDEANYWKELWQKAANGVLGLQADKEVLRNAIAEALNVLGGPNMDYAPAIANEERIKKIAKASEILVEAYKRS